MPKTKEELQQLKKECDALSEKLKELNEDELKEVTGGQVSDVPKEEGKYERHIYPEGDPEFKPNFNN